MTPDDLLGLPLETAQEALASLGIVPEVEFTANPHGREEGQARVIRIRDGGKKLTAACFLDPLAVAGEQVEHGRRDL